MSRLIIRNLPKNITESQIREIFSEKGTLTDVQLKYTKNGKFRQFAFIGYHAEEEAKAAIDTYHNSHIKTNKITVESCSLLGDFKKPKSWSKYASDSTAYKQLHPETVVKKPKEKVKKDRKLELLEKYKNDSQFEEFMQLHAPQDVQLLNSVKNVTENNNDSEEEENSEVEAPTKLANQQISDTEYMNSLIKTDGTTKPRTMQQKAVKLKIELFTLKLSNLPYNCKKKDLKDFFRPLAPYSIRVPRNIKGIAYVGFKTEKKFKQASLKDKSIIRGKQISVMRYIQKNEQAEMDISKPNKWKSQEEALKHTEDIAESGRIFIRNLSYTTTEDEIREIFSKYGPVTEVNLPVDFTTRKPKGFGVVTFMMPEHAAKAYTELDGSVVRGRMLHLLPGKANDAAENDSKELTNYKQKKASKQKEQAGLSHNWNSLFLGHNAVADVIAKTYRTSKENVLDPHGDSNAAVRLALGETQIVATTRKYLEQEGVHLDAFNEVAGKRSKTVILVKNLPAETKPRDIRESFSKYGVLGRIIFPPSGITAIVEFIEPSEARKAFTNLAYSKFKRVPLYLEWAPENSLIPKTTKDDVETSTATEKVEADREMNDEEDDEPEPDTTLFVKNLNFTTNDQVLRLHFENCGKIHYAMVVTKKDPNDPQNRLSMGYGFVRFMQKAGLEKALKTLQCSTLEDKTLELKRSERTLRNDVISIKKKSKVTKQTGTKLLVRNVPFQANYKELKELFKTFGEIKALRLPKKMTGDANAHRGFAFVDYFTNGEAKKAFEALCQSTHLYGRRLVLEWASADDGIEELRKRTADHFHQDTGVKSKKSVLDIEKM